jgi:hypothetical protein
MTHLDGNALAGLFADTLGIEITAAIGRCASCHQIFELARAHAFITAIGAVLRCDCTALSRPPMPLRPALRRDRPSPRCCPATQGQQRILDRIFENCSVVVYLGHHQPALHGGDD